MGLSRYILNNAGCQIWASRSSDRRHWGPPLFVTSAGTTPDTALIAGVHCAHGVLAVRVVGADLPSPAGRRIEVPIADLERDSDGDGLTDRLEQLIGTDPHRADTNEDGIPDGVDKNPLARAHPLSDEEAIYQAAVEALCQLASTPRKKDDPFEILDQVPSSFKEDSLPLFLPWPPGSRGIRILGYPGVILPDTRPLSVWSLASNGGGENRFTPPAIRLDGTAKRSIADRYEFFDQNLDGHTATEAPVSFREFFPFVLSGDGNRARVGWTESFGQFSVDFDIEVARVGSDWLPVECQPIRCWYMGRSQLVIPMRPLFDGAKGSPMAAPEG